MLDISAIQSGDKTSCKAFAILYTQHRILGEIQQSWYFKVFLHKFVECPPEIQVNDMKEELSKLWCGSV